MRLSTKLGMFLVSAVVITGMVIGLLSVEGTTKSFDNYIFKVTEKQLEDWSQFYHDYYIQRGSWADIENVKLYSYDGGLGYNLSRAGAVLTNTDGIILQHPENRYLGAKITKDILVKGWPLYVENEIVGYLFPSDFFDPATRVLEMNFNRSVISAVLKGTFFTSVFAILVGIAMAGWIVRPLRDLARASVRISKEDFSKPIPIYSQDELGEVSRAFNIMAKKLDQANNTRKQLFADISHELRTPLTVLASKLEGSLETNQKLEAHEISALYDEVIRLSGLVNELQDLSRLEAGQMKLQKTNFKLRGFIDDLYVLLDAEAYAREIEFNIDVSKDIEFVYADQQRFKQIILNLVNNALRYTPAGGTVQLMLYRRDGQLVIEVKDNGIGISEEDLEYIFQRFYRAEKSRGRKSGGSGLGLAITKGFVEAHGGTMEVESQVAVGTTFRVILPQEEDLADD